MEFKDFCKIRKKMCEKSTCEDCVINREQNKKRFTGFACREFCIKCPEEAEKIILDWYEKHKEEYNLKDLNQDDCKKVDIDSLKQKFVELTREFTKDVVNTKWIEWRHDGSFSNVAEWAKKKSIEILIEAIDSVSKVEPPKKKPLLDEVDLKPIYDREAILRGAAKCVLQDRNNTYGEPEDVFEDIANVWNSILDVIYGMRGDIKLYAQDVALLQIALKMVKGIYNPQHIDNYVDIAGYAVCAGEIVSKNIVDEEKEK